MWTSYYAASTWNGQKTTEDCTAYLPVNGGQWYAQETHGVSSGTTASYIRGNACVDLYWSGSSHQQLCIWTNLMVP